MLRILKNKFDDKLFLRDSLIMIGILLAITITYFAVIYRAQSAVLQETRKRLAETERQLKIDALQASHIPPMIDEIERMRKRYDKTWDRRLPKREELAGFLREIASALSQERLSNQYIQPGNPTRKPLYNCLPITMKFEGKFLALAGFLKRIDEMTRLTRVERLSIKPIKTHNNNTTTEILQTADSPTLAIEVGLNIYFTEQ